MNSLFYHLKNFWQKHPQILLWGSILIYIFIFSLISFWKYNNFAYNGIDLGIYNQVFWNTAEGRFFESSIQAGSYLGDHFEPLILLLLPFYLIFKHPLTLLILQTIFLALGAGAIFLISREILANSSSLTKKGMEESLLPLILSLLYLLNPFIQNINLFEFHILPFAIPFLLFTFYFYQTRRTFYFYIFIFLSLLVREDVALVVFMFGILALIDYSVERPKLQATSYFLKWIIPPIIISIFWFILAIKIINHFNPGSGYKFLVYYSWLGGSNFKEIIINLLSHPLLVLYHILNIYNFGFILGLLLPFGFLPLLKPKSLILLIPPLLQTILGMGGSEGILQTHYVSLFLPALFIALIFVLKNYSNCHGEEGSESGVTKQSLEIASLFSVVRHNKSKEKRLFIFGLLGTAAIYTFFTMGPLLGSLKIIATYDSKLTKIKSYFLKQIPPFAPVLGSYEFFPHLSSRQKFYPLHYIYLGKKQFGKGEYILPEDTEYILINFDDIITFDFQFGWQTGYKPYLPQAPYRLRKILTEKNFGLVEMMDTLALFKKGYPREKNFYEISLSPYPIIQKQEVNLINKIKFLGFTKELAQKKIDDTALTFYNYTFSWQTLKGMSSNYQLKLNVLDQENKLIYQRYYPLTYGIYPTSQWKIGEIIQTTYWFYLPLKKEPQKLEMSLVELKGGIELNALRQTINVIDKEKQLGETIKIE